MSIDHGTSVPDEGDDEPLPGTGPRPDDETVSAEDLTDLQDDPSPVAPPD